MKKSRIFLLAVVMIMATAGVFATGSKLFTDNTAPNIYYSIGTSTTKTLLDAGAVAAGTLVYNPSSSTTTAKIVGSTETYNLYAYVVGSGYYALYTEF